MFVTVKTASSFSSQQLFIILILLFQLFLIELPYHLVQRALSSQISYFATFVLVDQTFFHFDDCLPNLLLPSIKGKSCTWERLSR